MIGASTLGHFIKAGRAARGLTLKDLARNVRKEGGRLVSAQYVHDIEHDRRIPSPFVLGEIARALGIDAASLAALAGQVLPDVAEYLRERPESGRAVADLFARAHAAGFVDWDHLDLERKPAARAGTVVKPRK